MASKLCCTAEQDDRTGSPDLPNARVSAVTPNWPLLPKQAGSPHSQFTSARSGELHELRQIFDNAQDEAPERTSSPCKTPRPRSSRPSIYSLHSLHKMTSMRSILRRKFSKDLTRKKSNASTRPQTGQKTINEQRDTVIKHLNEDPRQRLKVTKDDLRKDLLSDKKPAEGGYDSDAEVLDVVAKNIGKATPNKRPSIHSVDWAPSSGSRFAQVFSTPNLRIDEPNERSRALRRSHSATSMGLPKPSPLSPMRLPSLTTYDKDGVPWAEVMSESLRLSQFPVPPRHASLKPSKTTMVSDLEAKDSHHDKITEQVRPDELDQNANITDLTTSARAIEIRIQQPTSIASPRPSASVRRDFRENAPPVNNTSAEDTKDEDQGEDNHRRSVHLYSMRISHHLRSGSLLSSGFASNKVPRRWGRVLPHEHDLRADVASSIYSSRPQSPPESFGGSVANFSHSSVDLRKLRHSNSFPTDNEETPRPLHRYGVMELASTEEVSPHTSLLAQPPLLARKNSVAETKKSKFKEEFSPSPPKKKLTPSTSIMKFLNPKRLSLRSLSEANLQPQAPKPNVDGPFDTLALPVDRERRQSRSLISLQTEQEALGKNKSANHVWDKALKAHQEEKASMFLPKNKELAVHASPFRERSEELLQSQAYPAQEVAEAFDKQGDDTDVVGAWGRYPSHTRPERTLSFSKKDRVETRDFALEAAIRFASAQNDDYDEDMLDPTDRLPTPNLLPGEKKRKKKVGTGKMAKSHSMTFGRKLIKNYYAGIFKSSSSEFRQHGRGHRSSIASGGTLEHPELELLPEVFMSGANDGARSRPPSRSGRKVVQRHSAQLSESKSKGKLPAGDSMATLRPRRNSSAPNLKDLTNLHEGTGDGNNTQDRARVWSVYYEKCVPSFPRLSTDNRFALEEFGGSSCISLDRKPSSRHSHTVSSRRLKHSRNASQLSRMSNASRWSGRPKSLSMGEDDSPGEDKSLVSVRRSTMDLISMFKDQENAEHERVMSLTRAESRREGEHLAGL
ncbi:hypothetical protein SNOG_04798 [Parastagonospora nodorum SN15]|uniref:Uncharacterized protein n=1 Tax=Phaeosphaeria nodorum (strain SN15 / ATCC MYA-4574 / FGSC 10173) TaxID=321614 RepID=Q0UTW6_PHANO|nr:hypothetical protein SNOG_04798 [Parastagonospora nodorum SN15]EAT87189.2 hypothetical protein SNOG_04798 [Parastagonospora nodorum SN15]